MAAFGLSWFFDDRDKRVQRQKSEASKQLRGSIDRIEERAREALRRWFREAVMRGVVDGIRRDTRALYGEMFEVARVLEDGSRQFGAVVESLNRRLLVRTGQFLCRPMPESCVGRVVRDPGFRSKFLWRGDDVDADFCRQVGLAIGERIDGVPEGSPQQQVAAALRPASVSAADISVRGQNAIARVAHGEIGRAIGKGGINVSLASRLVGLRITVIEEEGHG